MGIYKYKGRLADNMKLEKIASIHADSINHSFTALKHNKHDSVTCPACQSKGRYFRSLVKKQLNLGVV